MESEATLYDMMTIGLIQTLFYSPGGVSSQPLFTANLCQSFINIFDNNLCALLKLYILLYADDTVLLAESPKD